MKHVLIFSLAPLDQIGGAEVAVKELTSRLPQFQFEVVHADLKSFWSKYFFPLFGYRRAIKLHQQKPFDLVWAIMANQAGMAAALFKKRFPTLPLVLTLQEGDDLASRAYRLRLLAPRLLKVWARADQIQAISNYLAAWARSMGATCPITVIPNGVDLSKLSPKDYHPSTNPIIVTTSRLVFKNGVDILIEALSFLPAQIKLWVIGDGPERAELEARAARLGLGERVVFYGALPSSQIGGYLNRADIFARPSRSEGLGNSFLEAMAVGLPTVGTPVGGIPDFLKEGETGWLAELNNPQSLASKIEFILDPANQTLVQNVISNAQNLVHERYDWLKIAESISQLFSDLIGKKW
jgi:glycosyltransferase involved in cell wall biosynthesis